MKRLSDSVLQDLPADIATPRYDRKTTAAGIVHIGIGAFHRAHQAVYTDEVMNQLGGDWGIVGVSLRSAAVGDQLNPQQGLYTVVEQSATAERYRLIGAVKNVLPAADDPAAVLALMARPTTHIVSLTVTEKGYCHDPATGGLSLQHADIAHDLANIEQPRTAIGFLVAALRQRLRRGIAPFTVLTCDNLPSNGVLLRRMVLAFAAALEPGGELSRAIAAQVSFPSTMVDRIVPATTEKDRESLAQKLCAFDEAMVKTEPFSQWIIEDNFTGQRPAWERAGALLVNEVGPFETMKLRLLNGSHSALAYLGYLSGYEYVYQTMQNPAFVSYLRALMDAEITPGLMQPEGIELPAYKATLFERFANPALKHLTWQIAMDGSQKLPQRLLDTIRYQLSQRASIRCLALAVAAWMRYITGIDECGARIDVQDPYAQRFRQLAAAAEHDPEALVHAYLSVQAVFGEDLAGSAVLRQALHGWLRDLYDYGARRTLERCFGGAAGGVGAL